MVEQDFVIATKDERQQYIACPEHDIPLTELVPGSLSHIVTTKNMLVSFLTMKAGSVFNLHTHPQEQFMIVIEGFCDEVIGDKIYRVEAGEVIHLPAGIPHGAFLRDIDCKAIDIFVPSREDYVQSFRKQNPHASLSFTD